MSMISSQNVHSITYFILQDFVHTIIQLYGITLNVHLYRLPCSSVNYQEQEVQFSHREHSMPQMVFNDTNEFFTFCVFEYFANMYVCGLHVCNVHKGHYIVSDPPVTSDNWGIKTHPMFKQENLMSWAWTEYIWVIQLTNSIHALTHCSLLITVNVDVTTCFIFLPPWVSGDGEQ